MIPKEKAKEIINSFRKYVDDGRHNGLYSGKITFENQIKCSIVSVDLIIEELSKAHFLADLTNQLNFWQEVKQEIEQL